MVDVLHRVSEITNFEVHSEDVVEHENEEGNKDDCAGDYDWLHSLI
jgi:hypothetical protein